MKVIVYIEERENVRELIELNIESKVDCEIISTNSKYEAVKILKELHRVDLVIANQQKSNDDDDVIYSYVKNNAPHISYFIFTETKNIHKLEEYKSFYEQNILNKSFTRPLNLDELIKNIHQILNIEESPIKDFLKIKTTRFKHFFKDKLTCNVYIKLSNDKFIKIINENNEFPPELIEQYRKKNINYFYIQTIDFNNFSNNYINIIKIKLNNDKISSKDKVELQTELFSHTQKKVLDLGISSEIVEEMTNVTSTTISIIQKDKNFWRLLEKSITANGHIAQHSLLLSYISAAICKYMDWNNNSSMEKLSMASLLHDVIIKDEEHAKYTYKYEIEDNIIDKNLRKSIIQHPNSIADNINKMNNPIPDVENIIRCHHETPDGSGFPRQLSCKNTPIMSCLFIIAEDFTNLFLNKQINSQNFDEIIQKFQDRYFKGNYKMPLEAFIKLSKEFKCLR